MASQQINEVEEAIKDLKNFPRFSSYIILSHDGIVIKWENNIERGRPPMPYEVAVHHAHLVLDLCDKSRRTIGELFEHPDNEVENVRVRTDEYEMIIAQHGNYTLAVLQDM